MLALPKVGNEEEETEHGAKTGTKRSEAKTA